MAIAKEDVLRDFQRGWSTGSTGWGEAETSPDQRHVFRTIYLRANQTSPTANTAGAELGLRSAQGIGGPPTESPLIRFRDQAVASAHRAIDEPANGLTRDAARLHELVDLAREEYPETGIPSPTVIAALGRFVTESAGALRAPSISFLPSGALWLGWRSSGARAAFVVLQDGSASFGLLASGPVRKTHVNFSSDFDTVFQRMLAERGPHSTTQP